MALSNIVNEPRREITETIVGLTTVGTIAYAYYRFGVWFQRVADPPPPWVAGVIAGMCVGVLGTLLLIAAAAITHWAGESICNKLERSYGIRLRPMKRYHGR